MSYNFFQPSARAEVEAAVRAVEQQTAAEIVVTVHPTSGTYRHADYLAGFVCALAALCVFLFHPEPFEYTFFPLELTAAFVLGAVVTAFFAPLRRLLVSRKLREKNVRTSANAAFVELGVFRTKGRTGILVYVATFEKRVVVVPDVGVDPAALGPEWDKALAALDRSVRGGPGALAAALAALGPLLAAALPRQADDVNELEDAVRA